MLYLTIWNNTSTSVNSVREFVVSACGHAPIQIAPNSDCLNKTVVFIQLNCSQNYLKCGSHYLQGGQLNYTAIRIDYVHCFGYCCPNHLHCRSKCLHCGPDCFHCSLIYLHRGPDVLRSGPSRLCILRS